MTVPDFLTTKHGRKLAYEITQGTGPGIVFLGGLISDMTGSKATHLQGWAQASGRAFLRFDYSGHGQSSGAYVDGSIGDWAADAEEAINTLTDGPQVLVGSSMGGWIGLILARRFPGRIAGLVGVAAAPDFTEDGYWAGFTDQQKADLESNGQISLPSDHDDPYIVTKHLIQDGRSHLVLRDTLTLPFPVRLLQGSEDTSVPVETATRILDHASGPDIQLTIVKDADHSFSTPECLAMIEDSITAVLA